MSGALTRVVVCNGELISPQAATISVLGGTLFGAFGVYESIQLRSEEHTSELQSH